MSAAEREASVSMRLPARDEAATIGPIVAVAHPACSGPWPRRSPAARVPRAAGAGVERRALDLVEHPPMALVQVEPGRSPGVSEATV